MPTQVAMATRTVFPLPTEVAVRVVVHTFACPTTGFKVPVRYFDDPETHSLLGFGCNGGQFLERFSNLYGGLVLVFSATMLLLA